MADAHRLAALDIGTVTTRLLVADVAGITINPLCEKTVITHLGEGVDETRQLSAEALGRVRAAIERFRDSIADIEQGRGACEARPVERIVAIATSAARDAENADQLEDMLSGFGIELMVIAGQREAQLSFLGACSGFARKGLLLADIGGGSTELVFGDARVDEDAGRIYTRIHKAHSFNLGCRRLTEEFIKHDPPIPEEMDAIRDHVSSEMQGYFSALLHRPSLLLVVGGTATTLVAVATGMRVYDPSRVNGFVMTQELLHQTTDNLAGRDLESRKRTTGLQPERAGVIVAGALVLESVLDLSRLSSFTTGECDILEGILLDASASAGQ